MKKYFAIFSTAALLVSLTACGVQENDESGVSSVLAPNLTASALGFQCGNGVVVVQVKNVGNAGARQSFLRIDQSNAGSQAFVIPALKKGESKNIGLTVKYKNGNLDAKIKIDSNNDVAESNENDNLLRLVCRG